MRHFIKSIFTGIFIGLGFFITAFIFTKAASLIATSGTPLTATSWNNMISNFFWGSGSGGIFYNGKVGIGTSSPNKDLHIKTTAGRNAELDIQSGNLPHWAMYQDETSQELRLWNGYDRFKLTTGGVLNTQGLCINGVCKTDWSQVGGSSLGVYQFTGTSLICNFLNAGRMKFSGGTFYGCDGTGWLPMASKKGSLNNPGLSCKDILDSGYSLGDGLYWIKPSGMISSFQAYCDMTTDGGGWTLLTYSNALKNLYSNGTVCLGISTSCAGDMKKFGVTTTSLESYSKMMIKSGDGKILTFQITVGSNIHNIFTQNTTYGGTAYTHVVEKDTFFNHATGSYPMYWRNAPGTGFFISFGPAGVSDDNIGDRSGASRGCGRGTNLNPLENQTTLAFYMK